MVVMDVLKQRKWTNRALREAGFAFYERKKTVVLARELPSDESPKRIKTAWDTLVAHTGFMICYDVSDKVVHDNIDAYNHWPVEPRIFLKTYRTWDSTPWKPNRAEKHLMELGCKPYFKQRVYGRKNSGLLSGSNPWKASNRSSCRRAAGSLLVWRANPLA